jgi:hypothetical protein
MKQRLIRKRRVKRNAGSGPRNLLGNDGTASIHIRPIMGLEPNPGRAYQALMSGPTTKAGKLLGSISELTVREWDQLLVKLSHDWTFAYTNRQLRAKVEGDTTPPPEPPAVVGAPPEKPTPENVRKVGSHHGIGTIANLVRIYREDQRSPYHTVRFNTRANYDDLLRRIVGQCGDMPLCDLGAQSVQLLYEGWADGGKKAMGHTLVTMLRGLISFGATLEDAECERISGAMRRLKFEYSPPRLVALSAEQAASVCENAHKMGLHSIALAQAFQFDCKLTQKDVVGEWVPASEPGDSNITFEAKKWLRGILWSEINGNFILRHVTSRKQEEVEIDLKSKPMVMAELMKEISKLGGRPSGGPVVVCEETFRPWGVIQFRRKWRKVARAAGVPDDVCNMDTSSGGPVISSIEEKLRRVHRRKEEAKAKRTADVSTVRH